MLIVKVHYGLGNQLFQYAFARSMSLRKNIPFALDLHFYAKHQQDQHHPRVYQLNRFRIEENIAPDKDVMTFKEPGFVQRRVASLGNLIKPYFSRRIVYERGLSYDPNILRVNDDVYLSGYWQDLRYFEEFGEVIRKDLQWKEDADGRNRDLLKILQSVESVGIHFRRGDYLTDQYTVEQVGMADLAYYEESIARIEQACRDLRYFVFTDDPEWVKRHFNLDSGYELVTLNDQKNAFEDLRLLSSCKHRIISNSSFAWWGAWLGERPGAMTFAPAVWRKNGPDMYTPAHWRRV